MPSALVALAPGSEELEAIAMVNPLRRAGVEVTLISVGNCADKVVTCARSTKIVCDANVEDATGLYDAIILPGGMPGATNFRESEKLVESLKQHKAAGKIVAAICAAPAVVLAGIAELHGPERKMSCYPAKKEELEAGGVTYCESNVTVDGQIVTGSGPGTALEFGLALVGLLCGEEKKAEIAKGMLFQG